MKSELHLQAARGRLTPSAQAYLPDSDADSLFADDAEMARLLAGLERTDFFAPDSEERKARILRRCLARADEFYRDLPVPADATWEAPAACRSAWFPEAHRAELRERLETLRAVAETIIIYPTPHWSPREYQIDLILHDGVAAVAFDNAVSTIKRSFGGRTFGIQGMHAQLSMAPRSAFEHPSFFLGTPFPFLHEHLATFAETLVGPPPRIPAPPSRAERIGWCAQYFLFHRFTSHYRPDYLSKDCNFWQLAAIRLFLDKNVVATNAEQVRRAYLDTFVKEGEESQALDFLLRGDDACPDKIPFAAVLELQSREYDAVEALLRREGALS